jgi:hypothetical protein
MEMKAEPLTDAQLDHYRPMRIWRALDAERRHAAAEAFWKSDLVKDADKAATIDVLATTMHFRHQTIRTAPPAKRAGYLANSNALNDQVAGTLLYVYHMERQKPLLTKFLDALGVEHEDGQIKDEMEPPAQEALEKAVDALFAECDRKDVLLYLETLLAQDAATWGPLAAILEARQAE